ncbi:MAG: transposase [Nigerium sp.]|nr:transposase [Nigerium sp.]
MEVNYTSDEYATVLDRLRVESSVGRTGICYDNALAESTNGALKVELVNRRHYPTREIARKDIARWIELFYNQRRLHSTLGYKTPNEVLYGDHSSPIARLKTTNNRVRKFLAAGPVSGSGFLQSARVRHGPGARPTRPGPGAVFVHLRRLEDDGRDPADSVAHAVNALTDAADLLQHVGPLLGNAQAAISRQGYRTQGQDAG